MAGHGNLADIVGRSAHRDGGRAALVSADEKITWAQLDARVDALATGLRGLGLSTGDRVALSLGNSPDFCRCYFAVLRAGLVAVPVNPGCTARELAHLIGDSQARAIITVDPAGARAVRTDALEHVIASGAANEADGATARLDALLATPVDRPVDAVGGGEDLAVLAYTSGTHGTPRGAMLSHRALLANLEQCSRISPPVLEVRDMVLLVLPLFHIYGLNTGLGMLAHHGATGLLVERFDPVATLELMARHEVTVVVGAPPMYVAWSLVDDEALSRAFAGVRLALSGSAPLPPAALQRFRDATGHHVFEGYGLTETAPVLTSTLMSETAKPDSLGKPVPGIELRLIDEGGSGETAAAGDPGEIVVRGPNLFSGYWPGGTGGPGAEGWFATGDVAYADDDGDLRLVDRQRELILVSGFNVYPREVEQVLVEHPGIAEVAVIGIAHPFTGQTVKAVVVPVPGARLTAAAIIAHCARSLAPYKCPTAVELAPALPHSPTGKVRKGELRRSTATEDERPA